MVGKVNYFWKEIKITEQKKSLIFTYRCLFIILRFFSCVFMCGHILLLSHFRRVQWGSLWGFFLDRDFFRCPWIPNVHLAGLILIYSEGVLPVACWHCCPGEKQLVLAFLCSTSYRLCGRVRHSLNSKFRLKPNRGVTWFERQAFVCWEREEPLLKWRM